MGDDGPQERTGDSETGQSHQAEDPVVGHDEQGDQQQADQAGHHAGPQGVLADGRRHHPGVLGFEFHGQRAIAQGERHVVGLDLLEPTGDQDGIVLELGRPDGWCGHHLAIQHDGQTAVGRACSRGARGGARIAPGRHFVETVDADLPLMEVQPDLPLVVDEQRIGVSDRFTGQDRRSQQVALAGGVVTKSQHHEVVGKVVLRGGVPVGTDGRHHRAGADLRTHGMDTRPRA